MIRSYFNNGDFAKVTIDCLKENDLEIIWDKFAHLSVTAYKHIEPPVTIPITDKKTNEYCKVTNAVLKAIEFHCDSKLAYEIIEYHKNLLNETLK